MKEQLLQIGNGVMASFVALVPKLLVALALLLLGALLGAVAMRATGGILRRLRLSSLFERIGLGNQAKRWELEPKVTRVVSRTVFFLVLIIFVQSAVDILGLTAISDAVGRALSYLPQLVGALLIAVLGALLAHFLGGVVEALARDSGIGYASFLRRGVTAIVIFVVLVMAVAELEVDTEMIGSFMRIVLAGAALGLAITFGFGTREATKNLVAGFYLRKLLRPGEQVEVQGFAGTLVAVTPVQAVIEHSGGDVRMIANSVLLREVTKK